MMVVVRHSWERRHRMWEGHRHLPLLLLLAGCLEYDPSHSCAALSPLGGSQISVVIVRESFA